MIKTNNQFLFKPFTDEFARDPYSVYAYMRQNCPIYYHEEWDSYLLSTYEDIECLVRDKNLVRTMEHVMTEQEISAKRKLEGWDSTPYLSRYVRVNILDSEGELHDRLRQLIFKTFTPMQIKNLQGTVEKLVTELLDNIKPRGKMDFIEDFVAPIPGFIIGKLLGVPEKDRARLRLWSEDIVQYFEPDRTPEDIQLAERTTQEFAEYLIGLIKQKRQHPEDDLISELILLEKQGQLNEVELISTCMIILMAGHGSTIDVSGNGMLALLQNPIQMEKLFDDISLMPTAIREMFRYDPPLPFFHRFVLEDMEYKGHTFKKGTKLGILYGAANHDPAQFDNPDKFDISRSPNRHLAFGIGSHFCLGNNLARLNMEVMFRKILQAMPNMELAVEEPEFKIGLTSRGLKSLTLSW